MLFSPIYLKANDFISKLDDEYIISLLEEKANEVILSGNAHKTEYNYLQAKTINPTYKKSLYSISDKSTLEESNNHILEINEFILNIRNIPYNQAKLELDKKLFFYPNNLSLKLIYLKLANENNDEKMVTKILEELRIKDNFSDSTYQNSCIQLVKPETDIETNLQNHNSNPSNTNILDNKDQNIIEQEEKENIELETSEKKAKNNINYVLSIKYFLAVVIFCLIIRELKLILKSRLS